MKKNIPKLDYMCRINERVWWETIVGKRYEGKLKEWDSNVAIVELDDGTIKAVEC